MVNYSKLEDNALLKLASEGDRLAEECLAERYMRLVRVCARPMFLANGDSEDLIQEGMLGLISAIRQFKPERNTAFKTYAEHCIKNRLFSAIKAASSNKHSLLNAGVSLDSLLSDESQTPLLAYAEMFQKSPEEQVLARENTEYAKEFFLSFYSKLSKLEKNVLSNYLNGLSYREIAQLCNKDEKAIDNAIQRIRRKLAQNINSGDISRS